MKQPRDHETTTRRDLLAGAAGAAIVTAAPAQASMTAYGTGYRYCFDCMLMVNDRQAGGACLGATPRNGPHRTQGSFRYEFQIVPGGGAIADTPQLQARWRTCRDCKMVFFNGYPRLRCNATGRAHIPTGDNLRLVHDVPPTRRQQAGWRFCDKCNGLFFDGAPNKGVCAGGGGGHRAEGYLFNIDYTR